MQNDWQRMPTTDDLVGSQEARVGTIYEYYFFAGMEYELRHIDSGIIKKIKNLPLIKTKATMRDWDDPRSAGCFSVYYSGSEGRLFPNATPAFEYESSDYGYVHYKASDFMCRLSPSKWERFTTARSLMRVGDFVKFSGSKGRYPWRKIISIGDFDAYGQTSQTPDDKGLSLYSSSNGLITTQKIVRNGTEIFG